MCLQVISDILVHQVPSRDFKTKSPTKIVIQESDMLLKSISDHKLRMDRLNQEITKSLVLPESLQRRTSKSNNATPVLIDAL